MGAIGGRGDSRRHLRGTAGRADGGSGTVGQRVQKPRRAGAGSGVESGCVGGYLGGLGGWVGVGQSGRAKSF